MKVSQLSTLESVEALVLCGSQSRGGSDEHSDTDYAVFAHAMSFDELVAIKDAALAAVEDVTENLSLYSCRAAEDMASRGSLFLWHLRLEGQTYYRRSGWLDGLFTGLRPYSHDAALIQLRILAQAIDDIDYSLRQDDTTLLFEASFLYSIVRTIGIAVTTLSGMPRFGRLEPIFLASHVMGDSLKIPRADLDRLLAAKHCYARNQGSEPDVTVEGLARTLAGARAFLDAALQWIQA